jgi:hypothetical protein
MNLLSLILAAGNVIDCAGRDGPRCSSGTGSQIMDYDMLLNRVSRKILPHILDRIPEDTLLNGKKLIFDRPSLKASIINGHIGSCGTFLCFIANQELSNTCLGVLRTALHCAIKNKLSALKKLDPQKIGFGMLSVENRLVILFLTDTDVSARIIVKVIPSAFRGAYVDCVLSDSFMNTVISEAVDRSREELNSGVRGHSGMDTENRIIRVLQRSYAVEALPLYRQVLLQNAMEKIESLSIGLLLWGSEQGMVDALKRLESFVQALKFESKRLLSQALEQRRIEPREKMVCSYDPRFIFNQMVFSLVLGDVGAGERDGRNLAHEFIRTNIMAGELRKLLGYPEDDELSLELFTTEVLGKRLLTVRMKERRLVFPNNIVKSLLADFPHLVAKYILSFVRGSWLSLLQRLSKMPAGSVGDLDALKAEVERALLSLSRKSNAFINFYRQKLLDRTCHQSWFGFKYSQEFIMGRELAQELSQCDSLPSYGVGREFTTFARRLIEREGVGGEAQVPAASSTSRSRCHVPNPDVPQHALPQASTGRVATWTHSQIIQHPACQPSTSRQTTHGLALQYAQGYSSMNGPYFIQEREPPHDNAWPPTRLVTVHWPGMSSASRMGDSGYSHPSTNPGPPQPAGQMHASAGQTLQQSTGQPANSTHVVPGERQLLSYDEAIQSIICDLLNDSPNKRTKTGTGQESGF